jgi:Ketopantoate reductase PanE/ApbA C terminal
LSIAVKGQERLAATLQILQHFGFECLIFDEEATLMWSKLVFLFPVALSTAAARATIGEVLSDSVRAAQSEKCVQETCAVADRAGARVNADACNGSGRSSWIDLPAIRRNVRALGDPQHPAVSAMLDCWISRQISTCRYSGERASSAFSRCLMQFLGFQRF